MTDQELIEIWLDNHRNKDVYEITLHLFTLTYYPPNNLWNLSWMWVKWWANLYFENKEEVKQFISYFNRNNEN
jgi:hypothetical protein